MKMKLHGARCGTESRSTKKWFADNEVAEYDFGGRKIIMMEFEG